LKLQNVSQEKIIIPFQNKAYCTYFYSMLCVILSYSVGLFLFSLYKGCFDYMSNQGIQ